MQFASRSINYFCNSCLWRRHVDKLVQSRQPKRCRQLHRSASAQSPPGGAAAAGAPAKHTKDAERANEAKKGAFSQRMEQMTEDGIEQSGSRAGKVVEEAGFSEELKKRLEAKILDSNFRNENPAASAAVHLPVSFLLWKDGKKAQRLTRRPE